MNFSHVLVHTVGYKNAGEKNHDESCHHCDVTIQTIRVHSDVITVTNSEQCVVKGLSHITGELVPIETIKVHSDVITVANSEQCIVEGLSHITGELVPGCIRYI